MVKALSLEIKYRLETILHCPNFFQQGAMLTCTMSSPSHRSGADHSAYFFCQKDRKPFINARKKKIENSILNKVFNIPIVSSKDINGIPVCHNSVLTAPVWKSANESEQKEVKSKEAAGCHRLSTPVNMLPCADELITRRKSSPTMNGLKRAEIKCQIFHTVRTTMVEIYTRGHFG